MHARHAALHTAATGTLVRCTAVLTGLLALSAWPPSAHAATVYRCVDTHGGLTFQDTPCPPQARQTRVAINQQPLIGAPGEHHADSTTTAGHRNDRRRLKPRHALPPQRKQSTSWECRAADGEVFYRHTRCPGSIAGDGIARTDYAAHMARTRSWHDAWSRVSVHATRIPRAEACRRIHAVDAAGRDGHLRDDNVSAYARMTGHDPCADS